MEIYITEPVQNTKEKTAKRKGNEYEFEKKEITFIKEREIELEIMIPLDERRKLNKVRYTDYIPPEKNGVFEVRYCAFNIEQEKREIKDRPKGY